MELMIVRTYTYEPEKFCDLAYAQKQLIVAVFII